MLPLGVFPVEAMPSQRALVHARSQPPVDLGRPGGGPGLLQQVVQDRELGGQLVRVGERGC